MFFKLKFIRKKQFLIKIKIISRERDSNLRPLLCYNQALSDYTKENIFLAKIFRHFLTKWHNKKIIFYKYGKSEKKFFLDYQLWVSFSSIITSKTLKRLSPTNKLGRISSQVEMTTLEAETEKQLVI